MHDELQAQLNELRRKWYENEIESDTFAYEMLALADSLIPYVEHSDNCPMNL